MPTQAPNMTFPKGRRATLSERLAARVENLLIVVENENRLSDGEALYLEVKLIEALGKRRDARAKIFREKYCGIPCDMCRDNGKCQIGVYAARER